MGKNALVLVLTLVVLCLFVGFSSASASASSPVRIISGYISYAVTVMMKWLWSLKAPTKTAISGRPMMRFESGYTVETVFDGSKLGIELYAVEALPSGELLILDSANSNLYKISSSLSSYNRPKLVAGSAEGYSGHVDGKPREARMYHPKGLAVDDRGNIYIADTLNMAIRKISEAGVTTITGGKGGRGGGHIDGPSEGARFSNDFDVVYLGSSCSLLVIDRGNQAIREIQLHFDDCAHQYGGGFPLGIAVLVAAGFFGYMLALLQHRVVTMVFSENDQSTMKTTIPPSPYQKPLKSSVRPPLIPAEDEQEKQEGGFFESFGRLLVNTGSSIADILGGILPGFRRKPVIYQDQNEQQYQKQHKYSNAWSVQESFAIPSADEPPSAETRTPAPQKTYPFMSKGGEKMQQLRTSHAFYSGWEGDLQQQRQRKKQQHHRRHHSSIPQTYYQQSPDRTDDIVFGAVQEQDGHREAVVIKPLDHGNTIFNHYNVYSHINSESHVHGTEHLH